MLLAHSETVLIVVCNLYEETVTSSKDPHLLKHRLLLFMIPQFEPGDCCREDCIRDNGCGLRRTTFILLISAHILYRSDHSEVSS